MVLLKVDIFINVMSFIYIYNLIRRAGMPGVGDGSSQMKSEGCTNVWTQDVSRWSYNDNTSGAPSGLPAGAGTWLQFLSFTLDNI